MSVSNKLYPNTPLAEELLPYVTVQQLAENAAAYPEMAYNFTSEQDRARLERVIGHIAGLPLVHSTSRRYYNQIVDGLQPHVDRSEVCGHTGKLDKSLGLDRYTFLHMGSAEKSQYGAQHCIVSGSVLRNPNCMVTPEDIGNMLPSFTLNYGDQDSEAKARIERNYFKKMVTGEKWLEIIGRRILHHALKTDGDPFVLESPSILGEVKVLGGIKPDQIEDFIDLKRDPQGEHKYWKRLIELGFVPGPVASAGKPSYELTPSSYNKTAEEIGTNLDVARSVWTELLDL